MQIRAMRNRASRGMTEVTQLRFFCEGIAITMEI